MSNIKEVVRVDDISDLPAVGAERVMYIVKNSIPGDPYKIVKGFYWDANYGYREIVDRGNIVYAPFTSGFPSRASLTTIHAALEFLLNPGLAVIFNVTPDYVYSTSPQEVTFYWSVTFPVSNLASIVLKNANTNAIIDDNLISVTIGTTGQIKKQLTILQDTEFKIEVTDLEGNIATATDIIYYSVNAVSINSFSVSPETFNETPTNIIPIITLNWELSLDVEYATALTLERKIGTNDWVMIDDLKGETTGTIGTTSFADQTITDDTIYRLTVTSLGPTDVEEAAIDYVPYIDISFVAQLNITPDSGNYTLTQYTFNARVNKTSIVKAELYEVTSTGDIVLYADSILQDYMAAGTNYVDVTDGFSNQQINKTLEIQLPAVSYFVLKVYHEDEYGMTSMATSDQAIITYVSTINFESLTLFPTKAYPQTTSFDSVAVMTEPPLNTIDFIKLMYSSGSLTPFQLYSYSGSSALEKFNGAEFSDTRDVTIFNSATTYQFYMQYKEAGMAGAITSETKSVVVQNYVEISSLNITEESGVYSVLVRINKTVAQAADNNYTITESLDGTTYTPVGTITHTSVSTNAAFSFTSLLTPTSGSLYYVKIVENLGSSGNLAESEDIESITYLAEAKAYWGVVNEYMLNAIGYSYLQVYQFDAPQITVMSRGYIVDGDYTNHLSYNDVLSVWVPNSPPFTNVMVHVESATYNSVTKKTTIIYQEANISQVPYSISFYSHYNPNTEITSGILDTVLTDSYLVQPKRILTVSVNNPIELPYQSFEDDLLSLTPYGYNPNIMCNTWLLVPDTYPEYNEVSKLGGDSWHNIMEQHWVTNRTIGGVSYRLYVYRGSSAAFYGDYLGAIPSLANVKFRLNS